MPLLTEYHCLIAKEQTENTRPKVGSTLNHRRRIECRTKKGPALRAQTANRAHSKHGTSTHCHLNAGPPSRRWINTKPTRVQHSASTGPEPLHATRIRRGSWDPLCSIEQNKMDISITPSPPSTPSPLNPRPTTLDPQPSTFFFFFFIVYLLNSGNNIRSMLAHRLRRWPNIGWKPHVGPYIILDRGTIPNICGHLIRRIHV